jgi:hypothetical protein
MVRSFIALLCLTLMIGITAFAGEKSTRGKPENAAQNQPDLVNARKLLAEAGLGHLPEEDQGKVVRLLTNTVATIRTIDKKTADIADRAQRYFEAEGFKALYLKVVSVRGEEWLVVSTGLTTSATKDLPLMFSTLMFKEGYYFCKPALMGGITEMIDDSGRKQSFLFATWKDLR